MKNIVQFDFRKFKEGINNKILDEYERLNDELSNEELLILANLILMGKKIKPISDKKLETERRSVKTYLNKTFNNNVEILSKFLHKENIPFNNKEISEYTSIISFTRNDSEFNEYINYLDIEELEDLKQRILQENQFSKSLVEAIKSTDE